MSAPQTNEARHDTRPSVPRNPRDFPEEAFELLASLEGGHFWFRARNRLIVWALERYFPRAERLLEVGCGTGVVLEAIRGRFPAMQLVGADLSNEALRIARERVRNAHFVQLDAGQLPFRREFDVVCAFDILEHVDQDDAVLLGLAEATRPGGGILVAVPQHPWLWSAADDYGGHRRRYTKAGIEGKMRGAGFTVVRSTGWVGTLLPIVALSRLRDRRAGTRFDPLREYRIPAPINRTFELVLDLERAAIQRGLTLPFGTSRFMVGLKR
jgi:SAM-dependent methyltransferase